MRRTLTRVNREFAIAGHHADYGAAGAVGTAVDLVSDRRNRTSP
jgi:hypothetical protein